MNNKRVVMVLIIILSLTYLGLFISYIKDSQPNNIHKPNINNFNNVTIDKVLKFIDENKINCLDDINSSFTNEELTNQNKLRFLYLTLKDEVDFSIGVSYTKFQANSKKIFGSKIKIKNEDVYNNNKELLLTYDDVNEIYKINNKNISYEPIYSIYNHVIDYKAKNNKYFLTVNKFFMRYDEVYGSIDDYKVKNNMLTKVTSIEELKRYILDNYDEIKNEIYTYKYEFSIENNALILLKYEKIMSEKTNK